MTKSSSTVHKFLAVAIVLLVLFLLLFIFSATRSALDLWERLQHVPIALFYTYSALIIAFIFFSAWLVYKLLRPITISKEKENKAISEDTILHDLDHAEETGMDTTALRSELESLEKRKASGTIYVALFGDVSTGKSSIIKSLLPDGVKEPRVSVQSGSTQDISQYTWESSSGDKLVLTDLPGRNEADGSLNQMVRDEAVRAQIVVYVADSDFSRSQYNDIKQLQSFGKPMIVAFNKSDRFNDKEKSLITHRFIDYFPDQTIATKLVFVQSGGDETIVKVFADGREENIVRNRATDVSALAESLQDEIDMQGEALEQLRDASVFVLVKQQLDLDKDEFQKEKADAIVKSSTRKAILGALASVSPGSDLVIQGVLGTQMVKSLCQLYNVPVKQLDIDQFLNFSSGKMKKSTPLLLAVAGNGMKAFPGIGTVTGGLTHAVAYGLIFDALGHAVAKTLQQRGKFKAAPAAVTFRGMLNQNLEERATLFARLVFNNQKK